MKKILTLVTIILISCQPKNREAIYLIEGEAQGSTYHIKYISDTKEDLKPAIDSILRVIDLSLSTYLPASAITKINEGDSTVVVDNHFRTVFEASQQIWRESGGLFDPTVGVLVNAWGFGKKKIEESDLPTD